MNLTFFIGFIFFGYLIIKYLNAYLILLIMTQNQRKQPEQIPGNQNISDTKKVVQEQEDIPGERKEVNIENYEQIAKLAQTLKDLEFPANKNTIINFVKADRDKGSNILLEKLEKIEDKEYKNVAEVSQETGLAC